MCLPITKTERIMNETSVIETGGWERLLSYSQKEKYKTAIKQGYFNNYRGLSWRHDTFYGAFIWKHPNRVKIVSRFAELIGHKPGWEDLTDDNLRDLFKELQENYAPNSVRTLCAEISAVIRENDETREIPTVQYGKFLRAKKVPVQSVYLTMDEIKRIRDYTPRGSIKRCVKRLFMIECLTGARLSDSQRLCPQNIDEDGRTLTYVSQKSKTEIKVPIHKWLRPFLVSGDPLEPSYVPVCTYNRNIREICRICDINDRVKIFSKGEYLTGPKWKFVSSHTGRRSFATNLSLKGVSIEQISLMMGHMNGNVPNIQMTQRYIVGKMKLDYSVFKVFGTDEDY